MSGNTTRRAKGAGAAEAAPNPTGRGPSKRTSSVGTPAAKKVVTEHAYTVTLQNRHAEWVEAKARAHNTTPEHIIEQAVRMMWSQDPYKAGLRGGSTILKADFNPDGDG